MCVCVCYSRLFGSPGAAQQAQPFGGGGGGGGAFQ